MYRHGGVEVACFENASLYMMHTLAVRVWEGRGLALDHGKGAKRCYDVGV